jgi:IclR family acetate operon transcriptional repressor
MDTRSSRLEGSSDAPLPGGTESSTRVADVLLCFLDTDDLGVSEIARRLGLSKSVVHRVLQSLADRHLVQQNQDGSRYHLGLAAAALGARALKSTDLRTASMPILRKLAATSGETATVSALIGRSRVYLDQVLSDQAIRMQVELGVAFPLYAGASSRAILAFADRDLQSEIVWRSTLIRLTAATRTDPQELQESLDEIRRRGFATSNGERQPGAASIAAPVWDAKSEVVGSISVCGPATRFDEAAMARLSSVVRAAADEVSARLARRSEHHL